MNFSSLRLGNIKIISQFFCFLCYEKRVTVAPQLEHAKKALVSVALKIDHHRRPDNKNVSKYMKLP